MFGFKVICWALLFIFKLIEMSKEEYMDWKNIF
jgi:predicted metal-binding transcription factor (methanogenesis marker protein 9)